MNFIIWNKLQHRGTGFWASWKGEEHRNFLQSSVPPLSSWISSQKSSTQTYINIFHYDTNQASISQLLCCAAFAIQGILASFIQHHKAGIGIRNLAKNHCKNASCITTVPEGCWCVHNSVFSAVSQRFPNMQKHNLYHNVQQFKIKEIITLKPYFDWF